MKKLFALLLACVLSVSMLTACASPADPTESSAASDPTESSVTAESEGPIAIQVLILPKFESGEMTGDFPGEAQFYHEAYTMGGEEYDIAGGVEGHKLYVKDGIALYVTGMGKVNTSMSLTSILLDDRFDFSNAYVLSTGCGGGSMGSTVMGDVILGTATVDYDLGHHADIRDLSEGASGTWFHDESYDDASSKILNADLMNRVYDLVKDVEIATTEKTRAYMSESFDGAEWAVRDPQVLRGTIASGDNYWKGEYDHNNAVAMAEFYGTPDPFAISEMEDAALAVVMDRMGMLDRFIILRDSVNMDVFMHGMTAEQLWDPNFDDSLASPESQESADIFETAMHNNFLVGSVIIDAIQNGTL